MIDKASEIILYGSGERSRILLGLLETNGFNVIAIIDSNPDRWGMSLGGLKVSSPEALSGKSNAIVCVTFFSPLEEEPVWEKLRVTYGITVERLISFHELIIEIYKILLAEKEYEAPAQNSAWKICFDTTWEFGLGGVESWLCDLRAAFEKRNNNDICWLEVNEKYSPFSYDYIIADIRLILEKMPCTIVFSRCNELLLAACLLKKKFPDKLKLIMTVHGSCDGMYRDIFSYKEVLDLYVGVSSAICKDFVQFGISADKLSVMTIPVETDRKRLCDGLDNEGVGISLGYAGRLEIMQKRIDILLKLANELNERNLNFVLSIAGEGEIENEMKEYIKAHNLSQKVKLIGRIKKEEIPDFWANQDVGINTSDFEGRPLSVMESMIGGAVPVVTDTKGVYDDVSDNENGFIVKKGDYKAMADRIVYLSENPEVLRKMGKRARADMLEKMNMDKHVDFWMEMLRK